MFFEILIEFYYQVKIIFKTKPKNNPWFVCVCTSWTLSEKAKLKDERWTRATRQEGREKVDGPEYQLKN